MCQGEHQLRVSHLFRSSLFRSFRYKKPRTSLHFESSHNANVLASLIRLLPVGTSTRDPSGEGAEFDIIIEDGLHAFVAQMMALKFFYPYVSRNAGVYIIEDVDEGSWTEYEPNRELWKGRAV